MSDPYLKGTELIDKLGSWQQELSQIADALRPYKEPRSEYARAIALAITKLEEARMWLAEAVIEVVR